MGTVSFPQDAATIDDLLVRVDQALYRAKAQGRGQAHFYSGTTPILMQQGSPP
jgi:predicted signal transduction protein with EAL and GGDEF domain